MLTTEGKEGKDTQRTYAFKHIVRFERTNPNLPQPEKRLAAESVMDDAIEAALAKTPDGSHIGILTSPTMQELADIGYAPGEGSHSQNPFAPTVLPPPSNS